MCKHIKHRPILVYTVQINTKFELGPHTEKIHNDKLYPYFC